MDDKRIDGMLVAVNRMTMRMYNGERLTPIEREIYLDYSSKIEIELYGKESSILPFIRFRFAVDNLLDPLYEWFDKFLNWLEKQ